MTRAEKIARKLVKVKRAAISDEDAYHSFEVLVCGRVLYQNYDRSAADIWAGGWRKAITTALRRTGIK